MAKPWKIRSLNPDKPLQVCLRRILFTRLREAFSYEEGTLQGNRKALHDMRVAVRRIQSVFRTFRNVFPDKEYKKLYADLRTLVRILGRVREIDVFIGTLERFAQSAGSRDAEAVRLLIARQQVARENEQLKLLETIRHLHESGFYGSMHSFIEESL